MSISVKHLTLKAITLAAAGVIALCGSLPAQAAPKGDTISRGATLAVASDFYGCPSGAVCIYRDGNPDHLSAAYITNTYWSYGAHNLVNQLNNHWVLNNQYGGPNATAVLCYGYNGTSCTGGAIAPGWGFVVDLTLINSIVLNRP